MRKFPAVFRGFRKPDDWPVINARPTSKQINIKDFYLGLKNKN